MNSRHRLLLTGRVLTVLGQRIGHRSGTWPRWDRRSRLPGGQHFESLTEQATIHIFLNTSETTSNSSHSMWDTRSESIPERTNERSREHLRNPNRAFPAQITHSLRGHKQKRDLQVGAVIHLVEQLTRTRGLLFPETYFCSLSNPPSRTGYDPIRHFQFPTEPEGRYSRFTFKLLAQVSTPPNLLQISVKSPSTCANKNSFASRQRRRRRSATAR